MRLVLAALASAALAGGACHSDPAPGAPQPYHGGAPRWAAPPPPPPPVSLGPPCPVDGSYACASDRIGLLRCRGGRFVVVSTCRGARGCAEGAAVACDSSTAMAGDPCDEPGSPSCAPDHKTLLRCVSGTFSPAETCRSACLSTSGRVLCQ